MPAAVSDDVGLDLRHVEREAAMTRLFDSHHTELLRLAVLLGAAADAEDVVAEAFCELHRRWDRLRDRGAALPYLRSVVCNLARMRVRHLQVVRRHAEHAGERLDVDALSASAEAEVVLRDRGAALPYLRSVVCNLARMRVRHLQVVRRHAEHAGERLDVDALSASAEAEVVLREDQREVVEALRTLPARQRQALVLRYWLDLREAEVAEAMGISCGAVKAHTSRGMAALTRALEVRR